MNSAGTSGLLALALVAGSGLAQEPKPGPGQESAQESAQESTAEVSQRQYETGASLVRTTDLKAEPYTDARVLAVLAENLRVTVLSRSAGWLQVSTPDDTGWVKMFSVRWDSQASGASGDTDGIRKLFNLATTGSSGSTVTTASRGLDETKLIHPSPDPAALKVMQSYSVTDTVARAFADEQGLEARPLAYGKAARGKS